MSDSSFVKKAAIAGTLIAVGALGALWIASIFAPQDEEDRPPIIVNNGSAVFEALPVQGNAGSWKMISTGVWHHEDTRKGPDKFRVRVGGSDTADCQANTFENIERIQVKHSGATGTSPINVRVFRDPTDPTNQHKKFLRVETGNLDSVTPNGAVLTVDHSTGLKVTGIDLFRKNGTLEQSCSFSIVPPAIFIEQKK